jgi:HAD superfamily hydrolase (TIGR01509 family)
MHALVFDLDGTLVDTVYAHVLAWQRALCESDINVDGYRLHRHVGSSGDLIVRSAQREVGRELSPDEQHTIQERHGELFRQLLPRPRALPGAAQILVTLKSAAVPHAIATASYRPVIDASLQSVGVKPDTVVVEGKGALRGKPEPDLFLASREQLGAQAEDCIVVGDSVWDHVGARRAGMLSVGVLTGGYGEEELYHAGAFRVYRNLSDLLQNMDELGILL